MIEYEYGAGFGDGYGHTDDTGSGYGAGYGYGYSCGAGAGFDHGYGSGRRVRREITVGTAGRHEVRAFATPWCVFVSAGCQCHSIAKWRASWRTIAVERSVAIAEAEVDGLLKLATEAPMSEDWVTQ